MGTGTSTGCYPIGEACSPGPRSSKPPTLKGHVVQLYGDDDQLLIRHVASYVVSGLRLGAGVLMVATAEHTRGVLRRLRDHGVDGAGRPR